MTEIQHYLTNEVGFDFADGLITRREALRRLLLLGLSASAATSLLAACAREAAKPRATSSPTGTSTPQVSPVVAESITFPGPEGRTLQGAFAASAQPKGAVLVIHENRGLTDHIRSVSGRFAGDGYSALAIDLLSEEGGTASFPDSAQATAALAQVPAERFVEDMKAGVSELARKENGAKVAVVGFCFGGGMVWRLLDAEPRLSAAVPFYGPSPSNANFSGSNASVLAIYAESDGNVNSTRDAAKQALDQAGLTNEVVTFPETGHAFFNDTGARYNPEAAAQAYSRVLDWFKQHLG